MEILKKTCLIFAFSTVSALMVFSQSESVKQASIYKSYEYEIANNCEVIRINDGQAIILNSEGYFKI